ncbi:hypothetical protein R80B4_00947 [Fibrobacteres bacterium R8-0-B4]
MEKDNVLWEFGVRLKRARLQAKMSQDELAKVCGYGGGRSVISLIESGKRNPPLAMIVLMAETLGTTPSALAFGDTATMSSASERQLLTMFWTLNLDGQRKMLEYIKDLCGLKQYQER